jgi:hypothetical protein
MARPTASTGKAHDADRVATFAVEVRKMKAATAPELRSRSVILILAMLAAYAILSVIGHTDWLAGLLLFPLIGALPPSPPATAIGQFNTSMTKREDISELLFSSMALENTVAGLLPIGEPFADPDAVRWTEDSLNIYQFTDTTAGGQNATDLSSLLNLTAGQGASLTVGTVLYDTGQTLGLGGYEYVQVTGVNGDQITVARGYGASTKVTHAQNAVWQIVGAALAEVSDLDKDISKNRIPNNNLLARLGLSVQVSDEQLQRAMAGYVPGVPNELDYQITQRVREIKRMVDNVLLVAKRASISGDYSLCDGIISWLLAGAVDQAAAVFTPDFVNSSYATVFGDGGDPDWLIAGQAIVRKIANLYSDRIRIEQSERSRGWSVIYFEADLAKPLRIILDAYTPAQAFALVDSRRVLIRPFLNSFFYFRTAESFRDGEAARVITKFSLQMNNTKSQASGGAGRAHQLTVRAA